MQYTVFSICLWACFCRKTLCINPLQNANDPNNSLDEQYTDKASKLEQITRAEAEDILMQYYPENEISIISKFIRLDDTVRRFNDCVQGGKLTMDFRTYFALTNFKGKGHKYLYNVEKGIAYQAFEMVNALLSVGEKSILTNFMHDDVLKSGRIDDNRDDYTQNSKSLWRGEIRARSDSDHFITTGEYSTANRFVSFSKSKTTALDFVLFENVEENQIRVLYEFQPAADYFRLDFESVNFNFDIGEVVLYPNMNMEIIDSKSVQDDMTGVMYRLMQIRYADEMSGDEWKRRKYEISKKYFDRARRIQQFHTRAELPRSPFTKRSFSTLEDADANGSARPFKRLNCQ